MVNDVDKLHSDGQLFFFASVNLVFIFVIIMINLFILAQMK